MALAGRVAAFYRSNGASIAFISEAMSNSGDNKDYFITSELKRYWDDHVLATVEMSTDAGASWSVVSPSLYRIEYAGGHVVFSAAQPAGNIYRVSGKAFNMVQFGGGFNWSIDNAMETTEATTFESEGFKEFVALLKEWSGSLDCYWISHDMAKLQGERIVTVFYVVDSATGGRTERYEGFAILSGLSIDSPVDALVEQSIDLQGDGTLYYRPAA